MERETRPIFLQTGCAPPPMDYLSSLYEAPREEWRSFVTGRRMLANRGNFVAAGPATVTCSLRSGDKRAAPLASKVILLRFVSVYGGDVITVISQRRSEKWAIHRGALNRSSRRNFRLLDI